MVLRRSAPEAPGQEWTEQGPKLSITTACQIDLLNTTQCEVFSKYDITKEMSFCFSRQNSSLQKRVSGSGWLDRIPTMPNSPTVLSHFSVVTLPQRKFLQSIDIKDHLKHLKE